jgi:bacteriorhodopsin
MLSLPTYLWLAFALAGLSFATFHLLANRLRTRLHSADGDSDNRRSDGLLLRVLLLIGGLALVLVGPTWAVLRDCTSDENYAWISVAVVLGCCLVAIALILKAPGSGTTTSLGIAGGLLCAWLGASATYVIAIDRCIHS